LPLSTAVPNTRLTSRGMAPTIEAAACVPP
jgi:hypothetical protein